MSRVRRAQNGRAKLACPRPPCVELLTVARHGHGEVDVDRQLGLVVCVGDELEVVSGASIVHQLVVHEGSRQERRNDGDCEEEREGFGLEQQLRICLVRTVPVWVTIYETDSGPCKICPRNVTPETPLRTPFQGANSRGFFGPTAKMLFEKDTYHIDGKQQ